MLGAVFISLLHFISNVNMHKTSQPHLMHQMAVNVHERRVPIFASHIRHFVVVEHLQFQWCELNLV